MKTYLTLLIALFLGFESHARLHRFWNYEMLNENATLIVIATPTKVAETPEVAALPDIETVHNNGTKEKVMAKGVETSFEVLAVLKGERNTKTLVMHHFKLVTEDFSYGGPQLINFEPKDKKRFLMFLQKEADGRYVAVSGQTDPVDAVKELVDKNP